MAETGLEHMIRSQLRTYLEAHEGELPPAGLYYRLLATLEVPLIEESLRATRGNQLKAAKLLGLNRNTLHKKMKQYGLAEIRPMRRESQRRREMRG